MAHISEVNLYLNDLPPGDSTEVVLGPVMALAVQPAELKNPALTVNGRTLTLPVTLKSGDFLELEPTGDCAHYNDKGDLLALVRPAAAAGWPVLRPGENAVAFDCEKPPGVSARAEVTAQRLRHAVRHAQPAREDRLETPGARIRDAALDHRAGRRQTTPGTCRSVRASRPGWKSNSAAAWTRPC